MRATFAILLFLTATAMAGPRQDMLAGIARCNVITDDRQFLDCVYGAAQPVRAELGLPPASPAQLQRVPPASGAPTTAAATPKSGFSLFDSGSLRMTAYGFNSRGLFTVTLNDGSVWRQDANDTNFAHFSGKASNYPVTVVAGAYGKSRLEVRGEPGPYLVERER